MAKRATSITLSPEVALYLEPFENKSKVINDILLYHFQKLEEEEWIRGYQFMQTPEFKEEISDFEVIFEDDFVEVEGWSSEQATDKTT